MVQLHTFATKSNKTHVNFVTSKARVAPVKKLSLPRLELLATLIGARLLETLRKVFKVTSNYILFSDSTVALSWIRGNAKQWKPFVSNCVHEIQDLTNPQNWRFVKGEQNPSDIVSRGCSADVLKNKRLWHRPDWLVLSEENWPKNARLSQETTDEEKRVKYIAINYSSEFQNADPMLDINNISSISKVFRITAWIRRFFNNLKLKEKDRIKTPLTAEEIEEAEEIWIKKVQTKNFAYEINCLKENKNLHKDSKIRDLYPFLDEKGILRISGRLQQSTLSYNEKHPILIPSKIRFTELLVKHAHEKVLHSGVADTLIQIREKYWIPKGRQTIKSVIRKCFICKKFNSRPDSQIMAPLLRDRIEQSPPFAVTGLDFAGPIYAKDSKEKFYILLCTCAVTRALHLELVTNLTTEAFLLAFRRFISRRGLCTVIYSDNARTFKRAEIELKQMWTILTHPDVKEFYASKGIKWKYIIERGAWWGGFYERLVRSVKTILRKVIGKSSLTREELETVLSEIEAVINSRPITYVDSDSTANFPLTPSHFLVGKRLNSLPAVKL